MRLDGFVRLIGRGFFSPQDEHWYTVTGATLRLLLGDIETEDDQNCRILTCICAVSRVLGYQSNPTDP